MLTFALNAYLFWKTKSCVYVVRGLYCLDVDLQQEQYLQKETLKLQSSLQDVLERRDSGEEMHWSDQLVRDQSYDAASWIHL